MAYTCLNWTIIILGIFLQLLTTFPLSAQPVSNPMFSSEIIFTKSSQTLGNTLTFGLKIEDVDLDGDDDIFIANYSDVNGSRLWINNGSGYYTLHNQSFGSGAPSAHDVDIADLNGDSYPDIFIVNHNAPNQIYFSNGNGNYHESSQVIGIVGDGPQTIQLVDIDCDGDCDAYIYNISAPNRIWMNDGNGYFTMRNIDYGGNNSNKQELSYFNSDSYPDLFISMRNGPAQIWINDGAGNFTNTGQALAGSAADIDCGDIDNDGDNDIASFSYTDGTIWLNQNNTGFFNRGFAFNEGAKACKLFDADLDGDYDLLTIPLEGGCKLWLNDGSGRFDFYGSISNDTRILRVACKDLDSDNDFDIVFGQEINTGGNSVYFNETVIVDVDENSVKIPKYYDLLDNYPNPFNPTTTIGYSVSQHCKVSLNIYDLSGRLIKTIVNEIKPAGNYEVKFDASNFSSGIYFYNLTANDFKQTKKMIVVR